MALVVDSGGVYEAREHGAAPSRLLLGEIGYMLSEWLGSNAIVQFLVSRCRQILKDYSDLNLGLCDASVVATAERLGIHRILTLDQRHFRVIRPSRGKPYTLLPADLK